MIVVRVVFCVLWFLVEVYSQTEYPYISFMGQKLPNHSYVNMTLVGEILDMTNNSNVVMCHTDLMTCCEGTNNHQADWYFPNGERVKLSDGNFYERRGDKQVNLLRRNKATSPFGIYRCDIPTNTTGNDSMLIMVNRNILYVGLHPSGGICTLTFQLYNRVVLFVPLCMLGDVKILKLKVSKDTLICISDGGPATTVTWTRDNVTITQGTKTVLDDALNGGYTHTLNVTVAGRQGTLYTCTVANNKPSSDSASITVQAYGT